MYILNVPKAFVPQVKYHSSTDLQPNDQWDCSDATSPPDHGFELIGEPAVPIYSPGWKIMFVLDKYLLLLFPLFCFQRVSSIVSVNIIHDANANTMYL